MGVGWPLELRLHIHQAPLWGLWMDRPLSPGPSGSVLQLLLESADLSPSLAADPEPGPVPRAWGVDENHHPHCHTGWQPPADAEGLPYQPGTQSLLGPSSEGGRCTLKGTPRSLAPFSQDWGSGSPLGLLVGCAHVCTHSHVSSVQVNTSCNIWGNSTEYRSTPTEEDLSGTPQLVSVPCTTSHGDRA